MIERIIAGALQKGMGAILSAIAGHGEQAEKSLTASLNQQIQRFTYFAQAWIRGILNS